MPTSLHPSLCSKAIRRLRQERSIHGTTFSAPSSDRCSLQRGFPSSTGLRHGMRLSHRTPDMSGRQVHSPKAAVSGVASTHMPQYLSHSGSFMVVCRLWGSRCSRRHCKYVAPTHHSGLIRSWEMSAYLLPLSILQQLGKLRCIFMYSYVKREALQAATLVVDTLSTGDPLHVSWRLWLIARAYSSWATCERG